MPRLRHLFPYDRRLDYVKREAEAQMALFDSLPKWARDGINVSGFPHQPVHMQQLIDRFRAMGMPEKALEAYATGVMSEGFPANLTERMYGPNHPNVTKGNKQ